MDKDTVIKLELSVEDVNIVMLGLSELPLKISLKTLQTIDSQAKSQVEVLNTQEDRK
jgi:hypothetical protein